VTEHLSQHMAGRYHRRELSAAELIFVDDHLSVCEACRAKMEQVNQTDDISIFLFKDFQAEAQKLLSHPAYEELDAYASENLSEAECEIVASHLQICSECKEEVQDLLAFKASLDTEKNSHFAFAAPAPSSLFGRLKDWLRLPTYRIAFQVAAACVLVALAISLLVLPFRRQVADLQAQVNQLQYENVELKNQSALLADLQAQIETLKQENSALQVLQPTSDLPEKTLALKDAGGTVTLDEKGDLQGLTALSPINQQLIKNALRSGRVVTPTTITEVITKAGPLMSSSSPGVSFALQSPVSTFVQSSRPLFRWRALKGAKSYVVTIYDAAFRVVAKSEDLRQTEWQPPADLDRGVTFRWQVAANVGDQQVKSPVPPAPEARFKVIESAKTEDLQQARQTLVNSHLALGVLYAQAGLLDDAERELQMLTRANPQAIIAKRLLQSVKARRR
jgi:anti-sigma factor RsiW